MTAIALVLLAACLMAAIIVAPGLWGAFIAIAAVTTFLLVARAVLKGLNEL